MSKEKTLLSPEKECTTIIEKLVLHKTKFPEKMAYRFIVKDQESETMTYDELYQRVFSLAAKIKQKAGHQERVILCAEPGLDFVVGFYACLAAGAVAVPVVPPLNKMMVNRFLHILNNVEPQLILFDNKISKALNMGQVVNRFIPKVLKSYVGISDTHEQLFKALKHMSLESLVIDASTDLLLDDAAIDVISRDDVAFIQYTSGSTADPKGVLITHGNLVDNSGIIQRACQTSEETICYSWLPPYHDMGLIAGIIHMMFIGGTGILQSTIDFIERPLRWLEGMSKYRCTMTGGPNFAYELCVAKAKSESISTLDLSCLRVAANGAEPINPKTMESFYKTFEPVGLKRHIFLPCYGLAESTVMSSSKVCLTEDTVLSIDTEQLKRNIVELNDDATSATVLVSSGIPMMPLRIVHPEHFVECQEADIGEIWLQGQSVAKGYYNNPEETEKTFKAQIKGDEQSGYYLRTGDLGFLHEGQLYVCGRIKNMIIIRGQNYYPHDIELAVAQAHPSIRKGCIVAYSKTIDGEESLVIVAELKPKTSKGYYREIVQSIKEKIGQEIHLIAREIHLVHARSIPKTTSGKLQRIRCKELLETQQLVPLFSDESSEAIVPKHEYTLEVYTTSVSIDATDTVEQEKLRNQVRHWVFTSILEHFPNLPPSHIDINKGFFDLGVDSIKAVEIKNSIQDKLGDSLLLDSSLMFNFPNIQAVIDYIVGALSAEGEENKKIEKKVSAHAYEDIAIIGMSCQFPGAEGVDEFWQLLSHGHDAVREISKQRWYSEFESEEIKDQIETLIPLKAGCIDDITDFDAGFFSIAPKEALLLDPQQRLLLTNAWRALESAAINPGVLRGTNTGVFIGISSHDYEHLLFHHRDQIVNPYLATGNAASTAAGRLSYVLGLEGPAMAIDTACSSSLVALHEACTAIHQQECDLAIVGGVNVLLSLDLTLNLAKAGMLSPDGACKTFDKDANGYVRGEGCGMVVLKKLSAAQRDNDRILAVIRGSAVNQDGASSGLTVPNGEAQKRLLTTALNNARLTASEVDFIECHGTGTSLGDPIEVGAIGQIYGAHRSNESPLYLGAVKTNIGHLEAAAGMAGLIKTILTLQNQRIPPNLHFNVLNPHIRLHFSAEIPTKLTPWKKSTTSLRAGVSSFGFSGTNAHVILEEAPESYKDTAIELPGSHVFVLSAKSKGSLESLIAAYQEYLERTEESLSDICYTAAVGRAHFQWRVAIEAESKEALIEALKVVSPVESQMTDESVAEGDLKGAYLEGKRVDWAGYYAPYVRGLKKVSLPTYCFEKTRYWLETTKAKESPGYGEDVHPLLGSQLPGYGEEVRFWQRLNVEESDYLLDHRVYDLVIVPGASMLESALGASHVLDGNERAQVEEMVFEVPLVLTEGQSTSYQVSLHANESGHTGKIYSSTNDNEWVLHARFRVSQAPLVVHPMLDVAALQRRLSPAEVGSLYERLEQVGLNYGKAFHTISEAYVGEQEVLARVQVLDGLSTQGYRVHPTLLDGVFQSMALVASDARLYIPSSIEKVEWFSRSDRSVWAHVQLRERDAQHLTSDIDLYTLDGVCIASIEGLSARAVSRESLRQMEGMRTTLDVYREALEAYELPSEVGCLEQALAYGFTDEERPSTWDEGKTDSDFSQRHVVIQYKAFELMGLVSLVKRGIQSPPLSMTLLLSGAYGEDAAVSAWAREALGFWRSVRQEASSLRLMVIDSESLAEAIAMSNVGQHTLEPEVVLRGSQAYVPRLYRESVWYAQHHHLAPPKDNEYMAHGLGMESLYWQTRDLPALGPRSVRLRMLASALNFRDVLKTMLLYPGEAGDLGYEGVGEVLAVGDDVEGVSLGMRVMVIGQGLLAGEVVVDRLQVAPLPSGLNPEEGASIPIVFLTAQHALLQLAQLKEGQRVLIHAAAGGVGLAAIQMAKRVGAKVYATASHSKQGYLRELGIAHVYDSRSTDFATKVLEDTQGVGVDVVLNSLTSDGFIAASLSCLKENGVFLEIGKLNVYSQEQMAAERADVTYHLIAMDERMAHEAEIIHHELDTIADLFQQGALTPLPMTVFALQDSIKAFQYLQAAKHIGKVVLDFPRALGYDPKATYLITGGVGALGQALVEHMIGQGAKHFVLTSRHALDEVTQAWCAAHDAQGVEILHAVVDVADKEALAQVFASIRDSDYPLKGIFHAAGVLHDGLLMQLSDADFNTVLAPKVMGARHLDALSQDESLDYFVMFSSIAGLFGNIGQSNYAAANAYMDGLAKERRRKGLPGLSINFGPFAKLGMASQLAAAHQAQGVVPMTTEAAFALMDQALKSSNGQCAIMHVQWEKLPLRNTPYLSHLVHLESPSVGAWYQLLEKTPSAEREAVLVQQLKHMVSDVLQLESSDAIDIHQGFFDLGMDSLMAVELKNKLQQQLGSAVTLSNTLAFDYGSIAKLAGYILEALQFKEKVVDSFELVTHEEDIAIIGMSATLPGASDVQAFWEMLCQKNDGVRDIPASRFDVDAYYDSNPESPGKMVTRRAGMIEDIDQFDAGFFAISPKEAMYLDPQQRLLLMHTWRALEDAGINPQTLKGSDTGVFIGIATHDYSDLIHQHTEPNAINAYIGTGNALSTASGRISYTLGLEGPNMAIDTACSSSLVALHEAIKCLRGNECRLAIVGGVNALLNPDVFINFSKAGMLAPDGKCKTFDAKADGYVRGEGCGAVILKPLSQAKKDGDRILAVLKASGVNQDGASSGLTVPSGQAQERLLRQVLAKAHLVPDDIDYIECHGTGTSLGDPIEVRAIDAVYGDNRAHPLYLGSVKSSIGHLEAAAGVAGLIKTVLALTHHHIPGQLHFHALNPLIEIHFEGGVAQDSIDWPFKDRPRRAALSSFGFSGTNAHVILEEAPDQVIDEEVALPPSNLFVLSAKTKGSLESLIESYKEYLQNTEDSLADICYTAAVGRAHFQWRVAIDAESKEALVEALKVVSPVESQMTDERVAEGDLKSAYLEGKRVDWAGYYAPYVRGLKKVSLPTYCFEKTRYWLETTKAKAAPGYGEDVHPLLGSQLPGYGEEVRFWQRLNVEESDYLLDHRVYELVIMPGASMLESALGASHVLDGDERAQVEEMVFEVPLVLTEGQGTSYQVSLHANENGHTGKIYSSTNDNEWVLHARFRVSQAPLVVHPMLDVEGLQRRLSPAEVGSLYERLAQVGLNYGKAFRTISEAYVGEQEVLARVQVLDGLSTQGYRVHPTLLDGVFQSMALVASDARLYIPSRIEKVEWFSRSDRNVWAHVQLREGDAQHLTSDIDLYTLDGVCIASIKGLSARAVSRESLRQMEGRHTTVDVYREALEAYELPSGVGCLEQALAYGFSEKERPSTWDEGKTDSDFSQRHVVIQYKAFELMGLVSLVKRAIQRPPLSMTLLLSGAYGEDAVVSAWAREALGFWRSVRQEASSLRLMVIDSESLAEAIAMSNVGQHTVEPEVVLRGSQAYVPRLYRESAWYAQQRHLAPPKDNEYMAHGLGMESLYWQTRDLPALGPWSVRLRMLASALNFRDVLKTMHLYPGEAGDLGYEGVGEVLAVGDDVEGVSVGMRVMVIGQGLLAGEVVVDHLQVTALPSGLNPEEGASIPIVFLTAQHALLHLAQLKEGQRVLIHAAAGGVGLAAIQMAKRVGAKIYATASQSKQEYLRELGIAHVYDSRSTDFATKVLEDTQGVGVDVVLNSLTSDGFIAASLSCLKENGVFLEIGKLNVYSHEQMAAERADVTYHLIAMDERMAHEAEAIHHELDTIADLFQQGELTPLPMTVFALEDSIKAFQYLQAAKHIGKVVLDFPRALGYDPKATYLITGGVGALGQALVEHMIGQGAKHFVLTSRHGLDEVTQAWCAGHKAEGVDIQHAVVDVADKEGLEKVFESIRQNQHPLKGIFHAAGVLHDGLLMQLSDADFNTVLAPKVMGARHLDALSQDESLDYFVMFSSIAGLFGNVGQSNYAAANAYMDGLAKERRRKGLPGLSINFGPFAKRGMASQLAAAHQAQGVVPMTTQASFALMDQALKGTDGQCAIMHVQWDKLPLRNTPYLSHLVRSETPSLGAWYQLLEKTPSAEREAVLVQQLKHMVSDVLQLESSDAIDIHQGFFDLGMDSLMAVELKNKLQQQLGSAVTLSNTLAFDYGSIAKLAGYLLDQLLINKSEYTPSNSLNDQSDYNHRLATNQQLVFWEQQQLYGDGNVNLCISTVLRLKGKVNLQALEFAISSTIAEHSIFYSQFYLEEGVLKVTMRSEVVPVKVLDLSEIDQPLNKTFFDNYFANKYLEINKLTASQLFSMELISMHDEEHYLLFALHHILLDGAGMFLLFDKITDRYKQFVNHQVCIARPPVDYYNYFAKLAIKNQVDEKKLVEWSSYFAGIDPVLYLPVDSNDETTVETIDDHAWTLSTELSNKVIEFSKAINHSTFAVFFGVISEFLSQYTAQTDFALAATFLGRNNDIESEILGLFVQDLIVPIHIHQAEPIDQSIRRSYASFLNAYTFADVSNEELFKTLKLKRERGREPLAQVLVLMQNLQYPSSLKELNADQIYLDTGKFFYDLIFEIKWHSSSFQIIVKYKSGRYAAERIQGMLSDLNNLLEVLFCSTNISVK